MTSISLIITTYNWVSALNKCLESLLIQSVIPNEVIIADDGSNDETRQFIENFKKRIPCKLIHSWQEDDGFRAARSRNLAISKAEGDYIILIDGDIIMHKHFIKDHVKNARLGEFVSGRRVRLNKQYSQKIQNNGDIPSFYSKGIHRGREQSFRIPILSRLLSFTSIDTNRVRSCNMAAWRIDLLRVNGFNHKFIGWGAEDKELAARLLMLGLKKKKLKFAAVAFHLYHNESSRKLKLKNDELFMKTINNAIPYCEDGINEFIKIDHFIAKSKHSQNIASKILSSLEDV